MKLKHLISNSLLYSSLTIRVSAKAYTSDNAVPEINYKKLFLNRDKLIERRAQSKTINEVIKKKEAKQQRQRKQKLETRIEPYLKKGSEARSVKARRSLDGDAPEDSCDYAFIKCLSQESCITCFQDLEDFGVNWAGVSLNTPCQDVIKLLGDNNHCTNLADNAQELDAFCNTFNVCAVWEDDDEYAYEEEDDSLNDDFFQDLDCDSLTKCEWKGMHSYFLGDGLCHDFGCYNSEICGYDGGDCCADTCDNSSPYFDCGQDHFWCRDPKSKTCNPNLTLKCPGQNSTSPEKPPPNCDGGKELYQLLQWDTFGDGWDNTELSIMRSDNTMEVYKGTLATGYEGKEYLCLEAGCYNVKSTGGIWGNEVSWEVDKGNTGASIVVAEGGAPMECTFPIGGAFCDQTCLGKNSPDAIWEDDTWESYSSLETCLQKTCVIQLGVCHNDDGCDKCLIDDDPPSYCYSNDNYNALVDCAICHCSDDKPDYCTDNGAGNNDSYQACTSPQTLAGAAAIFQYSKCSNIDGVEAMISDWDDAHFGALDNFEECSHAFSTEYANGGKTAMDCMRILKTIIDDTSEKPAVQNIASDLYTKGEDFCNCASESHKKTPPCKDFLHFKVLLWESLDACVALDEIDCSAWSEFYEPCKRKMMDTFSTANFNNQEQCTFIQEGCDGVGPFPAFRRLDCGKEISKTGWDFYLSYQRGCLEASGPSAPTPTPPNPSPTAPAPSPSNPPEPPIPKPTPGQPTKPYTPSDDDLPSPSYASTSSGSHTFRWIILSSLLGAMVFVVYKRRAGNNGTFDYIRYQRHRTNVDFETDMSSRLTETYGFEPPAFVPTPGDITES